MKINRSLTMLFFALALQIFAAEAVAEVGSQNSAGVHAIAPDSGDEAASLSLRSFEARAKAVRTGEQAEALTNEAFKALDLSRVNILLNYPYTGSSVWYDYGELPASTFKDKVTVACLARPWPDYDRDENGQLPGRRILPRYALQRFADYMRERLNRSLPGLETEQDQYDAALTLQGRIEVARRFEQELVKAGLSPATRPDSALESTRSNVDVPAPAVPTAGAGHSPQSVALVGSPAFYQTLTGTSIAIALAMLAWRLARKKR